MKYFKVLTSILRTLLHGIVELLIFLPLFIAPAAYSMSADVLWLWICTQPLLYVLGYYFKAAMKKNWLAIDIAVSLLVGAVHIYLMLALEQTKALFDNELLLILCLPLCSYSFFKGLKEKQHGWGYSFEIRYMIIGIMLYLGWQMISLAPLDKLRSYDGIVLIGGIVAIILSALLSNERQLQQETSTIGRTNSYQTAYRQNRMLMAVVIGILLISSFSLMFQGQIIIFIKKWINIFLQWLFKKRGTSEPPKELEPPPVTPMFPEETSKEPAQWLVWLEFFLKAAAVLLAVLVIIYLIRKLGKTVIRLIVSLWNKLMKRSVQAVDDEDFIDEEEKLHQVKQSRQRNIGKKRAALSRKQFEQLWQDKKSSSERIRLLYSYWLYRVKDKHWYESNHQNTAQETGRDIGSKYSDEAEKLKKSRLLDLYDQARYSDMMPKDEELEQVKQAMLDDAEKRK